MKMQTFNNTTKGLSYRVFGRDGVLSTRRPIVARENLIVRFEGAPENSTATFEIEGKVYYRHLLEGRCSVSAKYLHGEIKVAVVVLDGSATIQKFACEDLFAEQQSDGSVLISPNDLSIPQDVATLKHHTHKLQEAVEALEGRLTELSERLDSIIDGYEI